MWNKMPHSFFGTETSFDEAGIVVFGAPFDSTTSFRPGTRFASRAMRGESYGLESYSPYQDADLLDVPFHDGGDLDLPLGSAELTLEQIEAYSAHLLEQGKLPVMIGGEHLVTLGAVRAAVKQHPDLHILHFDAHADLRDDYLDVKLSHATVLRRCWELVGDGRIFQFGIRSGDREEFLWGKDHVSSHKFDFQGLEEVIHNLSGKPVYFTLDLDVLDPAVFPGTGTPEAGGVSFLELLQAVLKVSELNLVGCDINELSPPYDASGASTAVANKILRELLIALGQKR